MLERARLRRSPRRRHRAPRAHRAHARTACTRSRFTKRGRRHRRDGHDHPPRVPRPRRPRASRWTSSSPTTSSTCARTRGRCSSRPARRRWCGRCSSGEPTPARPVGDAGRPRLARPRRSPEEHGGLGLGFLEVGIVVEELGRVVAPSPFLATVTQLAPLLREAGSTFLLADIAAGRSTGTLALAEDGQWRLDAVAATARPDRRRLGARRREVARARRRDRRRDRRGRARRRPGWASSSCPRAAVATTAAVDGDRPHAAGRHRHADRRRGRRRAGARRARRPRAPSGRSAEPLEEATVADGAVDGGHVPGDLRDDAPVRQGPRAVRPADRLVPGAEAPPGRLLPRRRAGRRPSPTSPPSPSPRTTTARPVATSMAKAAAGDCQRLLVRRRAPAPRRHRLHVGARPPLRAEAGQGRRPAVRHRRLPPRPDLAQLLGLAA